MPRPARPWFRFYSEALESRKVFELKPALFKHWVYLMMLANVSEPRGYLPEDIKDVAFALRVKEGPARAVLKELHSLRFLDRDGDRLVMHDWLEWQPDSDISPTRRPNKSEVNRPFPSENLTSDTYRGEESREEIDKEEETEGEGDARAKRDQKTITEQDLIDLQLQFPTLNIRDQWERAQDWMRESGKTKRDHKAFLRNWLRRTRDDDERRVQTTRNHAGRGAKPAATGSSIADAWRERDK